VTPVRVGYSLATLAPGYVGGTESYARGVLDGLRRRDADEIQLRVIANRAAASAYASRAGGNVELVGVPGRFDSGYVARAVAMGRMRLDARRLAARTAGELEVMHYPMTIPLPHTGTVPTVLTLQDMQHREHPEWFSRSELLFRRLAYDAAAQRAGHVITATRHARGQIVERLGIEPDRIEVIPHGIDHARFSPSPTPGDAERLSPLDLPRRFLLYPANMWPHKNHDRLIEALARTDDREVRLVLTGQDYGRLGALLDRARRLGVDARVTHLGHVAADVIPALYRRATGMVFPSLFEGFGIPVIEAMACGCPVASSDRSALPEVVNGAGLLFDPTDIDEIAAALGKLIAHGAGREGLVQAGTKRAAEFTWDRCADAHLGVYRRAARAHVG
jgi:glycosyltransferase involved in cell wall biosynthesis